MRPALGVAGSAVDASTGLPVSRLKAFPGYGDGQSAWERLDTRRSTNGTFTVRFEENRFPWRVRVEAEGYDAWISEPLPENFADTLEAFMQPLGSGGIRGLVLGPDGQPAAGAQVALLTLEHNAFLRGSRFLPSSDDGLIVSADSSGRFAIRRDRLAHSIAAASPAGFARLRVRNFDQPLTLQLQPWARIEGTVLTPNLTADARVILADRAASQHQGRVDFDFHSCRVPVAPDGRFTIDSVPPGKVDLYLERAIGTPYCYSTLVAVDPGKTTEVQLGGTGRTLVGKFAAEPGRVSNWTKELQYASIRAPNERVPVSRALSSDALRIWEVDFWQSPAGREHLQRFTDYGVIVAADGSFTIEGVPPGTYELQANFGKLSIRREIVVPDAENANAAPFDLGTVE